MTARLVPDWPDYEVTDTGVVYSLHGGARRALRPRVGHRGHLRVALQRNGIRRDVGVHRLVLLAFVGPCPRGHMCCHFDGNPANNVLANLRWDTPKGNMRDAERHGTAPRGEHHPGARLSRQDVRMIRVKAGAGTALEDLAVLYGVTPGHISSVVRGHLWKSETTVPPISTPLTKRGSGVAGSKLNERDVAAILASDARNHILADTYGVSRGLIGLIRKRRIWKHVATP